MSREVFIENRSTAEKLKLLGELTEEDHNASFHMIDTMLTKAKFTEFFQNNVATL